MSVTRVFADDMDLEFLRYSIMSGKHHAKLSPLPLSYLSLKEMTLTTSFALMPSQD